MKTTCLEVVRAALGEPKARRGPEVYYRCPGTAHANGDQHPSLAVNPDKNVWICRPCGLGGGAWRLAAFFANCNEQDKFQVRSWLRNHGLIEFPESSVKTYAYLDERGELLYEVIRSDTNEGKSFKVRRPLGNGEWALSIKADAKRNLQASRIVLYCLPDLSGATEVHIFEGEQCCDDFRRECGIAATTAPFGAGKWRNEFSQYFHGVEVFLYPDNDEQGMAHMQRVAQNLYPVAKFIKWVVLPGLPPKGDISDWIAAGNTADQLRALIADTAAWVPNDETAAAGNGAAPEAKPESRRSADDCNRRTGSPQDSIATRLIELATGTDFFHTLDGVGFASVAVGDHLETWAVRSLQFQRILTKWFYDAERIAPNASAMRDALATLDARANYDGPQQEVFVRAAEFDGNVYLDLADKQWRAVCVTKVGWTIVESPPVRFRRPRGMLPLPAPLRGGTIDELDKFINVRKEDKSLLRAWTSAAMMPRGPYPILNVHGEQGSAKSTTQRVLRALIDPNKAPLRTLPRDERDLQIAANNSHLLGFDNASYLHPWLSDAFCRLATGGGFATRELYADQEEVIFDAQRPVLLNGIEDLTARGDYLQRSIVIYLPEIADTDRRCEGEFWSAFEEARPRILGALLDAMAVGLRNRDTVRLPSKPRMADFAHWAVATEAALGIESGAFLRAYCDNAGDTNALALESSLVASHICTFVECKRDWTGTAAELLAEINARAGDRLREEKGWPRSARGLSGALRRLAPNLRAIGIETTFLERESNKRPIRLTKVEKQTSPPTQSSPEPRGANSGVPESSCAPSAESSSSNASVQRHDDGYDGHVDPADTVEVEL